MINERREERVPGETPFYYYCFDQAKKSALCQSLNCWHHHEYARDTCLCHDQSEVEPLLQISKCTE